jgi:hypothetical protein
MEIRVRATGAVMFENEWRRYIHEQSGLNFGQLDEATLNQYGADVVFEGPQATGGTVYQYSMRQGVEQSDGKWFTKYVLGPIFTDRPATDTEPAQTAAEQEAAWKAMKDAEQAKAVRADRNRRLADSDWTQLADAPVDKTAWATYRQALRDVPAQSGFPWNVQWPDTP